MTKFFTILGIWINFGFLAFGMFYVYMGGLKYTIIPALVIAVVAVYSVVATKNVVRSRL